MIVIGCHNIFHCVLLESFYEGKTNFYSSVVIYQKIYLSLFNIFSSGKSDLFNGFFIHLSIDHIFFEKWIFLFLLDFCKPGTYSSNGFAPCEECEISTYQDKSNSTSCVKCPDGQVTSKTGSTRKSDCSSKFIFFQHLGIS